MAVTAATMGDSSPRVCTRTTKLRSILRKLTGNRGSWPSDE